MQSGAILVVLIGVTIRLLLFSTEVSKWFIERNEFSTPISSWKRLTEGLTILKNGVSPYDGDLYHEMPLTLSLWKRLIENCGVENMKYFFVFLDVLIACVLYYSCDLFSKDVLKDQKKNEKTYHESAKKLMLSKELLNENKFLCLSCYLLNPLTIASCLSMNTAILNNLTTILCFHSALERNKVTLSIFLALSTYLSFYPFILIIPFSIIIAHHDMKTIDKTMERIISTKSIFLVSMLQTIICFSCFLTILLYFSFDQDWKFISSTFGFILSAPDHSPNIGIFWYFFVEHFEHFKLFFLCVFQIHAILYAFPLSIRLLHQPYFAAFAILCFFSIFKSYPSYTEAALWIAISFKFKFIFHNTRNAFISILTFIICSVIGVVFQYLWLQLGSANANFYFAATLGITTSQVMFVFDLIFSHQKRQHELASGTDRLTKDGKPAQHFLE